MVTKKQPNNLTTFAGLECGYPGAGKSQGPKVVRVVRVVRLFMASREYGMCG